MRLIAIVCALAAFLKIAESGEPGPIMVSTAKVERRDVVRWIKLPGNVEADAEITLYAKISGFLKDFKVDVGDSVKPGDVIGRLDAPEYEQDVKLAEAQLAAAQADLQAAIAQLARVELRGSELDAREVILEAEVVKARAEADRSRLQYDRIQKLVAGNAATEQERENQEYTWKAWEGALKVAEGRFRALKPDRDLWKKDVDVSKASEDAAKSKVGIAQATLSRARVWQAYLELKIPQIGSRTDAHAVVTRRFVSNGDLVPGGSGARSGIQPIVTLAVIDPVRVVVEVPESDTVGVDSGNAVQVSLHALPKDKPVSGKVSRTCRALAPSTRTLRAEIDLPNPNGRIKPGMMTSVELAAEIHPATMALPAACLQSDKQGSWVFTIESGKAKKIPVETGFKDHGWIEIKAGPVSENTVVIAESGTAISDGTPVEIKQP